MTATTIARADITIGDRARKDVGDITGLVESIRRIGLLQPIGITATNELVFGRRRLAALDALGQATIPVIVLASATDALGALQAELDENIERSPFTPTEATALRARIRAVTAAARDDAARTAREARRTDTGAFTAQPADDVAAPPTVEPIAAAAIDAKVSEITGVSLSTMQRVERIASARDAATDPQVTRAAVEALAAIDEGGAVKPHMDKVVAIARWPQLAAFDAEPAKVIAMARHLDAVSADGGDVAVQAELESFAATFCAPQSAELTAAAEHAFRLSTDLDRALSMLERKGLGEALNAAAGQLPPTAKASWLTLAERLEGIAALIKAPLSRPDGT